MKMIQSIFVCLVFRLSYPYGATMGISTYPSTFGFLYSPVDQAKFIQDRPIKLLTCSGNIRDQVVVSKI